ncbi:MAG: UDP-2,3-diacylglucosamine diphosphatase LpxI [Nitrospirae bacterium]|nr:UDP-2,3-diacylglucosamine diphosphatase LpxI [Nitrospirota bacterium]
MKTIGIIAGSGTFPLTVAQAARKEGYRVIAVAHTGETPPDLASFADEVTWIHVGELNKLIAAFKEAGVSEAVMAGGIKKVRLFGNAKPDLRALSLLARVGIKKDDSLLRALAEELTGEGIRIRAATELLSAILTPKGLLTTRSLTSREEQDVEYGWSLAKEIGRLDIGQCVVVKDRTVLAVEAIEGTDETIRRGGSLGREGAVVVKVSKPQQDARFDLPTVGPQTIEVMAEVGATVLALEAGISIMLERDRLLEKAESAGISVLGR